MIVLNMNLLELPEWDVVKATPISVPLTEDGKKFLVFNIPSTMEYFEFESEYVKFLSTNFSLFSNVDFLSLKDFQDEKLKEKMFKELKSVMQEKIAMGKFAKIIKRYFKAVGFNIKKILKELNPVQFAYIFLLIHNCVEFVKKKFLQVATEMNKQIADIYSISLKDTSAKIGPRY